MTAVHIPPENNDALLLLQRHCNALNEYVGEKKGALPVHIVLGHSNVGKNALLEQADLDFVKVIPPLVKHHQSILQTQRSTTNKEMDATCRFWLQPETVYITVPGEWLTAKKDDKAYVLWHTLVKFIKKHKRLFIKSCVFCLSIKELFELYETELHVWYDTIKTQLRLLRTKRNPITTFVILTQCDQICGFSEFFSELKINDTKKPLGITFSEAEMNGDIAWIDTLNHQFDAILENIHQLLLRRLHQEHNAEKRIFIKEFPLQLDRLRPKLVDFLKYFLEKVLLTESALPVGIFFTSALQTGVVIDNLAPMLKQHLALENLSSETRFLRSRPYFIQDLLKQRIPTMVYQNKSRRSLRISFDFRSYLHWRYALPLTFAAFLTVMAIGYIYTEYQADMSAIQNGERILQNTSQVTNQTLDSLPVVLNHLNSLTLAVNEFDKVNRSLVAAFLLPEASQLRKLALDTYRFALQKDLLPIIARTVKAQLSDENQSPATLYQALKAYIMLTDPVHMQPNYLINWLATHNQINLGKNNNEAQEIIRMLNLAMKNHGQVSTLDNKVIQTAREKLNGLPESYLVYLTFKNEALNKSPKFLPFMQVKGDESNKESAGIPYYYSLEGFKNLFLPQLIHIKQTINQDAWVLGQDKLKDASANQALSVNVIDLYFTDYAGWWRAYSNKLFAVNAENFQNLNGVVAYLDKLISGEFSFAKELLQINYNTSANTIISAAVTQNVALNGLDKAIFNAVKIKIVPQFQAFATLSKNDNPAENIDGIKNTLLHLKDYLQMVTTANDPERTAFQVVSLRFNHPDKVDPINELQQLANTADGPMQHFLETLVESSWKPLLSLAQKYINEAWQSEVLSYYDAHIKGLYPIDSAASNDISLESFMAFFKPKGIMDNFFNHYVMPFINTQDINWRLNIINHQGLDISEASLAMFERAGIIKQMFFTHDPQQITIEFTLQPVAMQPIVKSIDFDINGQSVHDAKGSQNVSSLLWPGNIKGVSTSISIQNINGQRAMMKEEGPWALFRLLGKAKVSSDETMKQFNILFDLDGTEAKYLLSVNNSINPFIPNFLNQFQCPEKI